VGAVADDFGRRFGRLLVTVLVVAGRDGQVHAPASAPGDPLDRAALLVDGDQEGRLTARLRRRPELPGEHDEGRPGRADATNGTIPAAALRASYHRILAPKAGL
jgi:hypothetical protein